MVSKLGIFGVLEQHMGQFFPHSNIKADPHISSKIHVWKKTYGALNTILSRSGFGWNDTAHVVDADDQVWDAYIQVHSFNMGKPRAFVPCFRVNMTRFC